MQNFDILIKGGTIINGHKNATRYSADVGIKDGLITAIGPLTNYYARQYIDAKELIVAPGFIDSHSHDDWMVLLDPAMHMKVSQGVTTVVTGNCGISLFPLVDANPPPPLNLLRGGHHFATVAAYQHALQQTPPAVNVAALVGHSALRACFMADLDRSANAIEIAQMQQALEQALEEGAIGLSTGTFYPPAAKATEAEIIQIGEPLKRLGGVYATHMRDEGDDIISAMQESWRITQALQVPCIISHHKLTGKANHGRSEETLALMDNFVSKYPKIGLDCYPYAASSTILQPERIETGDSVLVAWSTPHPEMAGRYLEEIAKIWDCSPYDAAKKLVPGGAIYFVMHEQDVANILAYPHTMIGSDGIPHDEVPHPRLWGTFPRVLGHYAREEQLFTLETAVHKMTGLTAHQFGFEDRGFIQIGMVADITLFDPITVNDLADFHKPTQVATGILYVINAGEIVLAEGKRTEARPGTMLSSRYRHSKK